MNFFKRLFFTLIIFNFFSFVNAQNGAIGQWNSLLSYYFAKSISEAGSKIYCATNTGLYYFDKSDNSINTMSKINGLSDIDISKIKYDENTKILLIAYTNTNLDLIQNNTIYNIPDIKLKLIPGVKEINDIFFLGNYAYLSSSLGVIVVDLIKKEIKDTYVIGENGNQVEVMDLAMNYNKFYAATKKGIYVASIDSPNLSSFQSWIKDTLMPKDSTYNLICTLNNKVYVNKQNYLTDSIFEFNGTSWHFYIPSLNFGRKKVSLDNCYNKLVIGSTWWNAGVLDTSGNFIIGSNTTTQSQTILDKDNILWLADSRYGLIKSTINTSDTIIPNCPISKDVVSLSINNNILAIAPGGMNSAYNNIWNTEGISVMKDNLWTILNKKNNPEMDTLYDINSVLVDPNDKTKLYAGSWARGLLVFTNNRLTKLYNETNSPLKIPETYGTWRWIGVGGMTMDKNKNLWVSNAISSTPLCVLKPDGNWLSFNMLGKFAPSKITQILIDTIGQKWVLTLGNIIAVLNDNGTLEDQSDDKVTILTNQIGYGNLPGTVVTSFANDLDGNVWVGTDKGIAVFYSVDKIFSGENYDAQQILINQGGHAQYLLEFETVTAIAVDGANRKWFGTLSNGVFLMSADGQTEIEHFTKDNSPLLSNNITSIAINGTSGEVIFGTDMGVISYKGTATNGGEVFSNVYAFPNPVPHNYNGVIAIKGLVKNAKVKITDESGTLVYQTTALGGQAIWNGKNLNGEKVQTGVYLAFCSNDNGTTRYVAKILFIN